MTPIGKDIETTPESRVSDMLQSGLSADEIGNLARRIQYDQATAAAIAKMTTQFVLTDELAGALSEILLAPQDPTAPPTDLSTYVAALGSALWSKDAVQISQQLILAVRALIVQRRDLVALRNS